MHYMLGRASRSSGFLIKTLNLVIHLSKSIRHLARAFRHSPASGPPNADGKTLARVNRSKLDNFSQSVPTQTLTVESASSSLLRAADRIVCPRRVNCLFDFVSRRDRPEINWLSSGRRAYRLLTACQLDFLIRSNRRRFGRIGSAEAGSSTIPDGHSLSTTPPDPLGSDGRPSAARLGSRSERGREYSLGSASHKGSRGKMFSASDRGSRHVNGRQRAPPAGRAGVPKDLCRRS
jgi:hypothetical protein